MRVYNQELLEELMGLESVELVPWTALRSHDNLNKLHYLACEFLTLTERDLGTIGELMHYLYNSGYGVYARQIDAMLESEGVNVKL